MKGVDQQSGQMAPPPQSYQGSYVEKTQTIQNQGYTTQQFTPLQGYSPYGYQPGQPGFVYPRTGWLTFVLVINWITVGITILGGILFLGIAAEFEQELGLGGGILTSIALIVIIFGVLWAWLTVQLNRYNNTARIINLVLLVLGFIGALAGFDLFTMLIGGAQIYALGFHKETIALFKPEQRFMG